MASINAAMSSLIKTLNVFPRERSIVTRERSKKVPLPRSGHHAPVLHNAWRFLTGGSAHSGCASGRRWGARLSPPEDGSAHLTTVQCRFPSAALRLCEGAVQAYHVLPYFLAKLTAELPVGAVFPLLFGLVVYPLTGLNPKPSRCLFPAYPPIRSSASGQTEQDAEVGNGVR